MEALTNLILLSRLQFALTTMFHILWPLLSIGLSVFLVVMVVLWRKTWDEAHYQHFRFRGFIVRLLDHGCQLLDADACRGDL
jgi:cytochrome d ubiquinol oxidase subunit I